MSIGDRIKLFIRLGKLNRILRRQTAGIKELRREYDALIILRDVSTTEADWEHWNYAAEDILGKIGELREGQAVLRGIVERVRRGVE